MLKLKPTTLIALDPYSAGFCKAISERFEREFGGHRRFLQTRVLVSDGKLFILEDNLDSVADVSFDLETTRAGNKRLKAEDALDLFKRQSATLEQDLINMMASTDLSVEAQTGQESEIEGNNRHLLARRFCLVLSGSDSFARGVVLDLARLIRWLFATKFVGEPYSVEAAVLLPDLFVNAESSDSARTYALLKTLDDGAANFPMDQGPPFDWCWLIDGRHTLGQEQRPLAHNLTSYSDAFLGLLTADPEMSGAIISGRVRGKTPAYSAFGHAELFFPADVTVERLSAALARDIITAAFLAAGMTRSEKRRKLVLAAKQFVLSSDFTSLLGRLETDEGASIWQGFDPKIDLREGASHDYISELHRGHEAFERESLLKFRTILLERSDQLRQELGALLDCEIDRRADAAPDGLRDALEFVETLRESDLTLQIDLLGERPQNLISEQRAAERAMDQKLGVSIDNDKSNALLDQIYQLHSQLESLQTKLRVTADPAEDLAEKSPHALQDESNAYSSDENRRSADGQTPEGERNRLIEEIGETQNQLQDASGQYRSAIDEEERASRQARFEASKKIREERAQAVTGAEQRVLESDDQLRQAKQNLEELREERRQHMRRHFIVYPAIALLVIFGIPAILAIVGIGVLLGLLVVPMLPAVLVGLLLYYAVTFYRFATGINRQFNHARDDAISLKRNLTSAAIELRRAHNDQLRIEYDLYAQKMRIDTLVSLIVAGGKKANELQNTLEALSDLCTAFDQQHKGTEPYYSKTRLAVLQSADIDAYYRKEIADSNRDADAFVREHVCRSKSRQIPIEEFRDRLVGFARARFDWVAHLPIWKVLRGGDLISEETATRRLRELRAAAQLLLKLSDADSNLDVSQRDTTLWAGEDERDQLLTRFRKLCPEAVLRPSDDGRTLRVLTRCLNFPAYFLGQIEFYRACYEREGNKQAESLPDLIPSDVGSGGKIRRVHRDVLLAIVMGILEKHPDGSYVTAKGKQQSLGNNRMRIAKVLASDFASQQLYAELRAGIDEGLSDYRGVHLKLAEFKACNTDLDISEQEILDELMSKYNPLS